MNPHADTDAEGKTSKSRATRAIEVDHSLSSPLLPTAARWMRDTKTIASTTTSTTTMPMETLDESGDDHDDKDSKKKHDKNRDAMLECALTRRFEDLHGLTRAFEDGLTGKKPSYPPICHGISAVRAWLRSSDEHEYLDLLEQMIDRAECKLEKLEERL